MLDVMVAREKKDRRRDYSLRVMLVLLSWCDGWMDG
jgi:hypothetical protein